MNISDSPWLIFSLNLRFFSSWTFEFCYSSWILLMNIRELKLPFLNFKRVSDSNPACLRERHHSWVIAGATPHKFPQLHKNEAFFPSASVHSWKWTRFLFFCYLRYAPDSSRETMLHRRLLSYKKPISRSEFWFRVKKILRLILFHWSHSQK